MIKLISSVMFSALLLFGCGWNGTPTRQNDFVPLTSIKIVAASPAIESSRTIAALTSTKLTVIGNYSGQFTRDITDQATWSSSATAVADFITTQIPNQVTGKAPGTTTLTAVVGGVSSSPYTLTVSSATITTLVISPVAPTIAKGSTIQLTATGTFSDHTTQDLTSDATWTADSSGFASISDDPVSKGLATGLAVGTSTITATFDGVSATMNLTITPAILQSIAVAPANSTVVGFPITVNFTATGTYSDGTTADVTSTATWNSSLPNIATISANGVASTVAAGTTSISATLGSITGNTNLTVSALTINATGLSITPVTITINVGTSSSLIATASFADGTSQNVTTSSVWTSSSPSIATVINGSITGIAVGSATITATYGGQTTTATVTIQ